jgi:hypothetical protein
VARTASARINLPTALAAESPRTHTLIVVDERDTRGAIVARLTLTRVHPERAVNARVARLTLARERTLPKEPRHSLGADAPVLAHAVRAARALRLAVAARVGPRALALVRVDAVDAEAAVVARGGQALVDVFLAGGPREAGLAATHVGQRWVVAVWKKSSITKLLLLFNNLFRV